MSMLRGFFLAFAIWGAVQPLIILGGWSADFSPAPLYIVNSWLVDPQRLSMEWDTIISTIVLCTWIFAETYVRKNWLALIAVPATWLIGVGCGLPLYLFLRTAQPR